MDTRTRLWIETYVRAANYLSVAQLYLQDNFLLERPLKAQDIKPRLLGHWGTTPGINFVYAQVNAWIKRHHISTIFVLGPGHGFPALQSNLFLENTLKEYYPEATHTPAGIAYLAGQFSWPYGFPSHVNPGTPGALVEGGELGYALSTACGAVLDNPDLVAVCLIGDGEAETGPTAASWHAHRFINPETNGIVLPILHLNGYKIGGPTIYGRMSNADLLKLFRGYGYEPIIASHKQAYEEMYDALEKAFKRIQEIKNGNRTLPLPMIIFKSPKGWTGPGYVRGKKIAGTNSAHQIVAEDAKTSRIDLKVLEKWLRSYHFNELFDPAKGFTTSVTEIIPAGDKRMGMNPLSYAGKVYKPLNLPTPVPLALDAPGVQRTSSMVHAGEYLRVIFEQNKKTIRLFSPDEIYSNKLDAILQVTARAWNLAKFKPWDRDYAPSGQVIEMLSEHTLQGLAQGYTLTGRHALIASYEAFMTIVSSMADQYVKFLKQAHTFIWRGTAGSLVYILTSLGWRQDHNGFSHQNPSFVSALLEKPTPFLKAYYPADAQATLYCIKDALEQTNGVAVISAGKTEELVWLTPEQAQQSLETGVSIWNFASDDNPEIIFASCGDYVTTEMMAAVSYLKKVIPLVRIRVVNIAILSGTGIGRTGLTTAEYERYFGSRAPIIFSYNGYPRTIKALIWNSIDPSRCTILGYEEEGSTTTPCDMHIRNGTSRYQQASIGLTKLAELTIIPVARAQILQEQLKKDIEAVKHHAIIYGTDPKEIGTWTWHKHI